MNKHNLYPLLFEPVYKEAIWGGTLLKSRLKRPVPPGTIGESWEIYDRDGSSSKVVNGPLAGKTLRELIEMFGKELMGERFDGGHFPLIVKLIDAGEDLSLQVHPDEKACAEIGNGAEPKTEMWHIIATEKDAKIIAGFKDSVENKKIFDNLESGGIENQLQAFASHAGDSYLIPAGLVHSIGTGNLILEIQQNSDTTYRIHDWNRLDHNGQPRQLHIEQARKSIRFSKQLMPQNNAGLLANTPYFQAEMLKIIGEHIVTNSQADGFHLLTAIDQPVEIIYKGGSIYVPLGATSLVPANLGKYTLAGKEQSVIRIVIPQNNNNK